jgi:hypothetical protein
MRRAIVSRSLALSSHGFRLHLASDHPQRKDRRPQRGFCLSLEGLPLRSSSLIFLGRPRASLLFPFRFFFPVFEIFCSVSDELGSRSLPIGEAFFLEASAWDRAEELARSFRDRSFFVDWSVPSAPY